jgi:hypothetical protein
MNEAPTVAQARQLIQDVDALRDPEVVAFGLGGTFGSAADPAPPLPALVVGRTYVEFGSVDGALAYRACCVLRAARPHPVVPGIRLGEVTRWAHARIEGQVYTADLPSLREAVALARMPAFAPPKLGDVVRYRDLEGPCALDVESRFCIAGQPVDFWRFMVESGRLSADPLLRDKA